MVTRKMKSVIVNKKSIKMAIKRQTCTGMLSNAFFNLDGW